MIKKIKIDKFRGFKNYTIDNIGQINLLVGRNNCGKTSILEAIRLLKSKGSSHNIFYVLMRRGEQIQYETERSRRTEADLCRLFYGYNFVPESTFSIIGYDNHKIENLLVSINEIPYESELFDQLPDFEGHYQLNVTWTQGNKQTKKEFPISPNGGLSFDYIRRTGLKSKHNETGFTNIEFVPTASLSPQKIISLFDEIVLSPDENLVLEALRIIEPDITRLASIGGTDRRPIWSSEEHARGGILVKIEKWEQRIPIGSLGDGIWRMLCLILSLIGAKDGILLIDEIDTGLHHTAMSKMWKLICKTAQELNVQIFATTHSSDCWKSLAENATNSEFNNNTIRIHRIDKQKNIPETFTNQEMDIALNREIEVR